MQDPIFMAKSKPLQCHLDVRLDVSWRKNYISITDYSFEICLHKLKHEMQVPFVRECIYQLDDIRILQLFEQLNFPQSREIDTFLLLPQTNFLDSNYLPSLHNSL